jgi:hypothetical protein
MILLPEWDGALDFFVWKMNEIQETGSMNCCPELVALAVQDHLISQAFLEADTNWPLEMN